MRTPSYTTQFERDLRLMRRRGKDTGKLRAIFTALINEEPLAERQHDHPLVGNYRGRRECHIEPDWLLIYKLVNNEIIFERTGTHGDLFE
ncbi:MAG: type II toxin-antitoxin system mRNA interferase toxin, RelE/StbE family [Anaerolineae bacterium CG03_land_8_20_14_0_80_58_20]|nr:MAG: damage-inducible protein [Anaerolineae bacterium CG1_02_58_13]PIV27137.1 MAG: type II toxin-antitoxin system mRNA interferase toxin, RelE/StbE family [Anaerolineae bacterium CG03_land_8_20_14_0_80_58_20]